MKKILITGSGSFLGKTLLESLQDSYEIVLLEHSKPLDISNKKNVKIIKGGVENVSVWEKDVPEINIVIHLAGITHSKKPDLYEKINAQGTQNIIVMAESKKVEQFIFISTRAIGENCGAYGKSKEKAEEYLKNSTLNYTILRVGEAYDEDFRTREGLGSLANLIKNSILVPYLADKSILLAPIYKDDVRDCIVATIDNLKTYSKTYTVAGPENLSFKQIVTRIAEYEKLKRLFVPIPTFLVKITFFIFSKILRKASPDQLDRLLCKKESLSENVATDLKIIPRKFITV